MDGFFSNLDLDCTAGFRFFQKSSKALKKGKREPHLASACYSLSAAKRSPVGNSLTITSGKLLPRYAAMAFIEGYEIFDLENGSTVHRAARFC